LGLHPSLIVSVLNICYLSVVAAGFPFIYICITCANMYNLCQWHTNWDSQNGSKSSTPKMVGRIGHNLLGPMVPTLYYWYLVVHPT
jgi:hypothetical protein